MSMSRGAGSTVSLMRHPAWPDTKEVAPLNNPLSGIVEVLSMGEGFVSGPLYSPCRRRPPKAPLLR